MADERLIALAHRNGIQTSHTDCAGKTHSVPARTLRSVLATLGGPAATDADVRDAIAQNLHPRPQPRDNSIIPSSEGPRIAWIRPAPVSDSTIEQS